MYKDILKQLMLAKFNVEAAHKMLELSEESNNNNTKKLNKIDKKLTKVINTIIADISTFEECDTKVSIEDKHIDLDLLLADVERKLADKDTENTENINNDTKLFSNMVKTESNKKSSKDKVKTAYIARFKVKGVCDAKLVVQVDKRSITILSNSILCTSSSSYINKMKYENNKIRRDSFKSAVTKLDEYRGNKLILLQDYTINSLNLDEIKELILGRPLRDSDANNFVTCKAGNLEQILNNKLEN